MVEEGEDVTLPPAGQIYRTNNPGTLTVGPLPPTDVQRPTPPLTEEELAALWDWWPYTGTAAQGKIRRLIADLRASRARIKELEEWLTSEGYHLD